MLDFGCGAGRVLLHLQPVAVGADLWACDIDEPSVRWLTNRLSPPVHVFRNDEQPPLPLEDGSFDLVVAVSVFSHLADTWSEWLLELRRVLRPDGLLLATFHGAGSWHEFREPDDPLPFDAIGMHVDGHGSSFTDTWGPAVYLSEWWLREHWGRAFDVVALRTSGFNRPDDPTIGQGCALLRPRPEPRTPADLRAPAADLGRELAAASTSRDAAYQELDRLRAETRRLRSELADTTEEAEALRRTLSWRITTPLRALRRRARRPLT